MNAKKLITATFLFTLGCSAFANDLLPFSEADNFVSTRTRAEVNAEVVQARRSGQVMAQGDLMPTEQVATTTQNTVKRADARAEAAESAGNSHGNVDRRIGS